MKYIAKITTVDDETAYNIEQCALDGLFDKDFAEAFDFMGIYDKIENIKVYSEDNIIYLLVYTNMVLEKGTMEDLAYMIINGSGYTNSDVINVETEYYIGGKLSEDKHIENNDVDNKKIITMLYNELQKQDFWFTTKNDPTYAEVSKYVKLDEYGCLSDNAKKQVIKELNNYIGEGATDLVSAIDLWITEGLMNGTIASKDTLVTKFKDKPVVDNIEAFKSSVQLRTENKKRVSIKQLRTELEEAMKKYMTSPECGFSEKDNGPDRYNFNDFYKNYCELKISTNENRDYVIRVNAELDYDSLMSLADELNKVVIKYDKDAYFDAETTGRLVCVMSREDVRNGVEVESLKKNFRSKENLNNGDNTNESLTENFKGRLQEENTKSQQLIASMLQADDFDSDSPQGQIVLKTSDLYNQLSNKGYDVQVSFDNGESQSSILLGQQGGQVVITITNANQPLQAFASGNFELTDDNITILNDIMDLINNIR